MFTEVFTSIFEVFLGNEEMSAYIGLCCAVFLGLLLLVGLLSLFCSNSVKGKMFFFVIFLTCVVMILYAYITYGSFLPFTNGVELT